MFEVGWAARGNAARYGTSGGNVHTVDGVAAARGALRFGCVEGIAHGVGHLQSLGWAGTFLVAQALGSDAAAVVFWGVSAALGLLVVNGLRWWVWARGTEVGRGPEVALFVAALVGLVGGPLLGVVGQGVQSWALASGGAASYASLAPLMSVAGWGVVVVDRLSLAALLAAWFVRGQRDSGAAPAA